MRTSRLLAILLLPLLTSGCAHIRIHRTSLSSVSIGSTYAEAYKVAFLGLKSFTDPVDISKVCPSGWETLESRVTVGQGFWRVLTLNFYSPYTVEVACSVPPAPKEEL